MRNGKQNIPWQIGIVVILLCMTAVPVMTQGAPRGRGKKSVRPGVQEKAAQDLRQAADPLLDNILTGFQLDNYQVYARDFSPTLRVSGARTKFFETSRQMKNVLGDYQARQFLGIIRKNSGNLVLWKAKFSKSADDVLISLSLAKTTGGYEVIGLWLE